MRYFLILLFLCSFGIGCSADMVNLDPVLNELDARITTNEAKLTTFENDFDVYKSSINAAINMFNQTVLDLIPPGFVLCVISSTTAFNWEVKYGTTGVKVTEILP